MPLNIRRANEDDCEIIAQILVASWRFAYKDIMPDDILDNLSIEQRKTGWENHLRNSGEAYLLCEESNIFGLVELCQFRDKIDDFSSYGEIPVIYLRPDKIGMGLGGALIEFALNLLADRGRRSVGIWVLEKNTRAIEFYRRHGFSFSGRTKQHAPTGLIEWLMVRVE